MALRSLILLVVALLLAGPALASDVLDLSDWDFEADGAVRLDGQWDLAPGVLVPPDQPWPEESSGAIRVPGSWQGQEVLGEPLPGVGVGTYRLQLILPDELPPMALRSTEITSAFSTWMDGRGIVRLGTVGESAESSESRAHTVTASFEAEGGATELRIQVANFGHRAGGLKRPIYLGTSAELQRRSRFLMMGDAALVAACLLFGVYHLLLWGLRRNERANVSFAIFALVMGFRQTLIGERVLPMVMGDALTYELHYTLLFVAMHLGVPLLLWSFRSIYPEQFPRWWVGAAVVLEAPQILLVLAAPSAVFTQTALSLRVMMLLGIALGLWGLVRAVRVGRTGAWLLLGGVGLLSAAVVHDILMYTKVLDTDFEMSTVGFIALLAAQASTLAVRFSRSFSRIETLGRQLGEAHAYNESILQSLRSGVLTMDREGVVVKANAASEAILGTQAEGRSVAELFEGDNDWLREGLERAAQEGASFARDDVELARPEDRVSLNVAAVPLLDLEQQHIGQVLVVEDISRERRIKATMARYMSHEVAERLIEQGVDALSGELSHATVLFSDIRRFTTLSEALGPEGTVAMLNEYFARMVDELFRYDGILDKYIGDAIMAVFGTLSDAGNHADKAVRCAIAMLEQTEALNQERLARGEGRLEIGLGLNTDRIIHGNIGSPARMDYTVIGDGVNLAARLESANATYGTGLLVSEFTWAHLSPELRGGLLARELDRISVKGKTEAVTVFEILEHRRGEEGIRERIGGFEAALALYRRREWEQARQGFVRLAQGAPADRPSALYAERCAVFQESPPAPPDWDGVWRMLTK